MSTNTSAEAPRRAQEARKRGAGGGGEPARRRPRRGRRPLRQNQGGPHLGQRLCDPGPSPTQPPLSPHRPPQWPLVGAPRTLPTCGRCGASDPPPLGGPRGPEGSPACRGQACRAGPGHSLSPVLGVMLPPNPLAGRQDAPARVPAHAHAHAGGSTHFGIGVREVELVQTVLPRVQEAPHGQGPVSAGDRAGQDAAERAGTPRRRQQGR